MPRKKKDDDTWVGKWVTYRTPAGHRIDGVVLEVGDDLVKVNFATGPQDVDGNDITLYGDSTDSP